MVGQPVVARATVPHGSVVVVDFESGLECDSNYALVTGLSAPAVGPAKTHLKC